MNHLMKKSICFLIIGLFLMTTAVSANKIISNELKEKDDKALLNLDIQITFTVKEIRAYDEIDKDSDPDFYVKLNVDGTKVKSPVWKNQKYVKQEWSYTFDAPADRDIVNITIELWDQEAGFDKQCDITKNNNNNKQDRTAFIKYHIQTGKWMGSDFIEPESILYDESGYGRLNGCDDHSYDFDEGDCELRFDITQTDDDGDGHYTLESCATPHDDCDDTDPTIYPGAPEVCDGKDNDCDDVVDNGFNKQSDPRNCGS